jgi:AhpD family alkylhydroperoxidase
MSLQEFREFRERMNERILDAGNLDIRRFFALDSRVYENGALSSSTKELLGLVASLVLRCDDCVSYHLGRCVEEGHSDNEILETLAVGLVVGGSIVIPHLRRAVATLDELRASDPTARDTPAAPAAAPAAAPTHGGAAPRTGSSAPKS